MRIEKRGIGGRRGAGVSARIKSIAGAGAAAWHHRSVMAAAMPVSFSWHHRHAWRSNIKKPGGVCV